MDGWRFDPHIHIARSVKHALKSMEEADRAPPSRAGYLYTQAYLSLTALYWTRTIGAGWMMVCGVEIHDSQSPLLNKIREALSHAEAIESDVDRLTYKNARFYALFTGAQAERTLQPHTRTKHYGWFNNALLAVSKEKDPSEWTSARAILQGFLYVDKVQVQPLGAQWWGATLSRPNPPLEI